MRKSWFIAAGVAILPGVAMAQAARHEMPPIILGNPGDWFGPDQYPADAVKAERQGRVIATISVDLTGRATACSITVSSGTTSLDKATCDIALEHAAFNPATDRRGRPTTSTYTLPVKWVLPERDTPIDATTAALDTAATVQIVVNPDGEGVSCRTMSVRGHMPDPCATFHAGVKMGPGFVREGRRVGATIVQTSSTTFTIDP